MNTLTRTRFSLVLLALMLASCLPGPSQANNPGQQPGPASTSAPGAKSGWQEDFDLASRKLSPTGESKYWILRPGFQLELASSKEHLLITVLDETREIGGITTRVVEEREEDRGSLAEVSRNFFAIDEKTGDVFYFGEEVDMFSAGQLTSHSGAWLAFENGNRPGLIMPGSPEVGMKYYQEVAPGVAMDRARIVSLDETISTGIGELDHCLLTQESSAIEKAAVEYKTYCPGIGLVNDSGLILVSTKMVP